MAERKVDTSGMDFIRARIAADRAAGVSDGQVVTRFPPEPNGYLHIGHAKSICLNFGVAEENEGICHLRFDDTNPTTEDKRYADAIMDDVRWLGFSWRGKLFYASGHFENLYEFGEQLIRLAKAYVCSLSEEEIRRQRGTVTEQGQESPYRDRSAEENLDLFRRMRAGEFTDGEHVLRAKANMSAANMKMRDPVLYRIRHAYHYRTADEWCIYPMYDFAHCLSDSIEGVTHSLCTLEFENNRELYDWILDATEVQHHPPQIEFARLNLDYTVMSKRKLLQLVEEGHLEGWDDPRMPTLAGLRRRGVTPEAIRTFCDKVGVAKADNRVDIALLEHCIRDDLNTRAPRVMGVLRGLKVVIENWPEGRVDDLDCPYWPHDVGKEGSRAVPFTRQILIERDDFSEDPPKDFYRLSPGREVRLRYAYLIRCTEVIRDKGGEIVELRCTYDPESRGGSVPDGRQVRGTIHWVSAEHALTAEVRLYDRLFTVADPEQQPDNHAGGDWDFTAALNPESLVVIHDAQVEPSLASLKPGRHVQLERQGYFFTDPVDSTLKPDEEPAARSATTSATPHNHIILSRTVTLRDTWTKLAGQAAQSLATKSDNAGETMISNGGVSPGEASAASGDGKHRRRRRRGRSDVREQARADDPELAARHDYYLCELSLSTDEADILAGDRALSDFFEEALNIKASASRVAAWVVNEVPREPKKDTLAKLPYDGAALGRLVALVEAGTIATPAAKEVFAEMARDGGDPAEIVDRRALAAVNDVAELTPIIERLLADHSDKVRQYRGGRTGLLGFFVGQVLRETGAAADPRRVQELLRNLLDV